MVENRFSYRQSRQLAGVPVSLESWPAAMAIVRSSDLSLVKIVVVM